jgi:hypothetical protein
MELASEHRGDNRSGYNAGGGNADHELRVILARNLQRERARELAEERPLDMQHSFSRIDTLFAW